MDGVDEIFSFGGKVEELEYLDATRGVFVGCRVRNVSAEKGYLVWLKGGGEEERWVRRSEVFSCELSDEEVSTGSVSVGEALEVRVSYDYSLVGWRPGRIQAVIDGFYHVTFEDGSDEVVEFERLRKPVVRNPAVHAKEIIGVPESVKDDILRTDDTLQELSHDLGLGALRVDDIGEVIEIIGPKSGMEDARQALGVYFQRVRRYAHLSGIQQALEQRLQDIHELRETAYELSFEVDHDVIGSCIGRAGVNLKKAHRIPGVVSVKVTDFEDEHGTQRHRFDIVACSVKAAQMARQVLEYVRVRLYVEPGEIGPVIGKKGIHLREIEQKTGVSKFVLVEDANDEQGPYFETVGTVRGVETAKRLFNMHRGYLLKNRQMEDDIRKLRMDLAQLGVSGNVSVDELQRQVEGLEPKFDLLRGDNTLLHRKSSDRTDTRSSAGSEGRTRADARAAPAAKASASRPNRAQRNRVRQQRYQPAAS